MTNNQREAQSASVPRTWFYWFMVILALYSVVWDGLLELDYLTHPFSPESIFGQPVLRALTALVIVPAILAIAWLTIRRSPGNVVGLLLVTWSSTIVAETLRVDSPFRSLSLNFTWPVVLLLPLYFPDGLPSPRRLGWLINILAALSFISLALVILSGPFATGTSGPDQNTNSTIVISALVPYARTFYRISGLALTGVLLLLGPSLVLRYRRSGQRERLQMKWLAAFSVLFLVTGTVLASTGLFNNPYQHGQIGAIMIGAFYLYLALFIPLAVANAIFRHRLYDIDIIIRRTLIYSTVTAVLALVYFAGIVLAQAVLRVLTGQTSDLAIVLSTLVIAALFTPLRQRIQNAIDRRFYRRRYDAERTLTDFGVTLRSEVDLDRLTATLVGVVQETVQPANISLWLREPAQKTPETPGPETA